MYLSNIKLWNFRKFGNPSEFELTKPHLDLHFTKGLNVLIGENDSGKTAIIDAIKLTLKTHAYEWIQIEREDFFQGESDKFRIELLFQDFEDHEAKHFTEWLGWEGTGEKAQPYLRIIFEVVRRHERIIPGEVRAGVDEVGSPLSPEAREYLKVMYLKPLRDAKTELIPKKNSRLSQILQNHPAFEGKNDHRLVARFRKFNDDINEYFKEDGDKGALLKKSIDDFVRAFRSNNDETKIGIGHAADLKSILERLGLNINDEINPGLGTLNRLFMSAELINLKRKEEWYGLRLGLIEELEAHLHPQAQMQVIEALQQKNNEDIQLILTTHSPNLASKVKLQHLIICDGKSAFPMGKNRNGIEFSLLKEENEDFKYMEKFLDVTKSNLFFAKGVILVEGWAEELLMGSLARQLGIDLTAKKVSVVNIGNTGLSRFMNIFARKDGAFIDIKVSIVTDLDVRPLIAEPTKNQKTGTKGADGKETKIKVPRTQADVDSEMVTKKEKLEKKLSIDGNSNIKPFLAKEWTLEWCLHKSDSLKGIFEEVVREIHCEKYKNGDFANNLASHLMKKGLKKTEVAYRIALKLDDDILPSSTGTIINDKDPYLEYLIKSIRHACGDYNRP